MKKVSVWSGDTHSKSVVEKIINDYNNNEGKEKNIFIDYQVKESSSYKQVIDLALESGEAPDMFATDMAKAVENGHVISIEELPGGEEFLKKYEGKLMENLNTYNGKTYTVPVSAVTQGLLYNKDMFKKAGLVDENGEAKPPKTWEELREYAKKLTNPQNKEYGIIFPVKWGGWYGSDVWEPMMV